MTLASGNGWLRARVIQQSAEKHWRGSRGQEKTGEKEDWVRTGAANHPRQRTESGIDIFQCAKLGGGPDAENPHPAICTNIPEIHLLLAENIALSTLFT